MEGKTSFEALLRLSGEPRNKGRATGAGSIRCKYYTRTSFLSSGYKTGTRRKLPVSKTAIVVGVDHRLNFAVDCFLCAEVWHCNSIRETR
jgi:hypothetical protein